MGETKTGLEGDFYLLKGTIDFSGTTTASGSRIGFCEGASWSWDENAMDIWDRGTFSHWKKGRGAGELTLPQTYVDNGSIITYLDGGTVAGSSYPRMQGEFRQYGTGGAVEHVYQFSDIALRHYEMNEPEGDDSTTWSMTFGLAKEPAMATGSLIS